MDMQEARDIAVRFLGGLPVGDDEVFEAGKTIRENFRERGLVDDDRDLFLEAVAVEAHDRELEDVL